jgi:hypothetical protein
VTVTGFRFAERLGKASSTVSMELRKRPFPGRQGRPAAPRLAAKKYMAEIADRLQPGVVGPGEIHRNSQENLQGKLNIQNASIL